MWTWQLALSAQSQQPNTYQQTLSITFTFINHYTRLGYTTSSQNPRNPFFFFSRSRALGPVPRLGVGAGEDDEDHPVLPCCTPNRFSLTPPEGTGVGAGRAGGGWSLVQYLAS